MPRQPYKPTVTTFITVTPEYAYRVKKRLEAIIRQKEKAEKEAKAA